MVTGKDAEDAARERDDRCAFIAFPLPLLQSMTTLNNHLRDLLVDQGLDNLFVVALVELSPERTRSLSFS